MIRWQCRTVLRSVHGGQKDREEVSRDELEEEVAGADGEIMIPWPEARSKNFRERSFSKLAGEGMGEPSALSGLPQAPVWTEVEATAMKARVYANACVNRP